ncbi:hypothetical protein CDL15_Pgr010048 [Punica granatum]|uniref:Uncharacterized protein n=1 Tax=Punica granatum TaxID=22663 RepID=A0A218X5X2_PUNGR|nr:hypothetical protein CDL15_Pgr010048 [Punica granatum]
MRASSHSTESRSGGGARWRAAATEEEIAMEETMESGVLVAGSEKIRQRAGGAPAIGREVVVADEEADVEDKGEKSFEAVDFPRVACCCS